MWLYESSRQALVFVDPESKGQGVGFFIPALEKLNHWQPKLGLGLELRKVLPKFEQAPRIHRAR
jgi:hypothetical protein